MTSTTTTRSLAALFLPVAAFCALAVPASAALMTFGTAQNITGDADVNNTGTTALAVNLTGTPGITSINGVTFFNWALGSGSNNLSFAGTTFTLSVGSGTIGTASSGFAASPFSDLSAPYQALLGAGASRADALLTLNMQGLTIGQDYLFQVWVNNSTDTFGFNADVIDPTPGGATVSLEPNTTLANGGLGQYVTATFTANATNQLVQFEAGEVMRLSGFQLRRAPAPAPAAVPEPGTALAGLIGLALCGTSRRRKA